MRLALLGGLVLAAATFAPADEKEDLKAIGAGRGLFVQYCASCHGMDARGAGPAAPALKAKVPDLTTLEEKDGRFDAVHVSAWIDGTRMSSAHGSREMPIWGKVFAVRPQKAGPAWAQADTAVLTTYVKSIQAPH
jgi:mono/diheme cytochrome c family protein